ncbi:hypothetical protein PSE_1517 [Pseudovibrio sp. FO-BEG1]|nr:hypothetical protein PSE_1517 [Pseudovibrio sp. FO-BEG1]
MPNSNKQEMGQDLACFAEKPRPSGDGVRQVRRQTFVI